MSGRVDNILEQIKLLTDDDRDLVLRELTTTKADTTNVNTRSRDIYDSNYAICEELVRNSHKRLIDARIEGRWADVVEGPYHRHYTEALLRRRGVLPHYTGKEND